MAKKEYKFNSINLLKPVLEPEDIWDKSYVWVTGAGRYILVLVELIVLGAFFTRFALDRQRNDLDESIDSKIENILSTESMLKNESKYREFQKYFIELDKITVDQKKNSLIVKQLIDEFPKTFTFESFSYNVDSVNFSFKAKSFSDIAKYTSYLNGTGKYKDIIINLSKKGEFENVTYNYEQLNQTQTNFSGDISVNLSFKIVT